MENELIKVIKIPKKRNYKRAKPIRRTNLIGMLSDIKTEKERFNEKYSSLANTSIADAYAKAMVSLNLSHSEKSRHLVVRVLGRMLYDKRTTPAEVSKIWMEIHKISGTAQGFHMLGGDKQFKRRNP